MTIEFTNCVWCDRHIDGVPHAMVDITTSIGRVTAPVCESCDEQFFKKEEPNE